jgi:hypothetical protein
LIKFKIPKVASRQKNLVRAAAFSIDEPFVIHLPIVGQLGKGNSTPQVPSTEWLESKHVGEKKFCGKYDSQIKSILI